MNNPNHRLACLHLAADLLRQQVPMELDFGRQVAEVKQPAAAAVIETAELLHAFVEGAAETA